MKKNKKKGFIKYLNPANLKSEINRYGYGFSIGGYLKYLLIVYAGLIAVSYIYKLHWQYILGIAVLFFLFLPSVFVSTYKNMYEQKRFEDISAYMEQLLYSFKRQPKILAALQDTLILFEVEEGERTNLLYEDISKAIDCIQNGYSEGNIYQDALGFIEADFNCKRLKKIHDFLIRVEESGGESNTSVDILLDDRKLWMDRIYENLKEKQHVKVMVTVCIGLSFLICGLAIYMLPSDFGISELMASQIATAGSIAINALIWYFVQMKLSGSILDNETDTPFKELERSYNIVFHKNMKKAKKKGHILAIIVSPLVYVLYSYISPIAAAIGLALVYFLWTQPSRQYKVAFKRIRKEVEKVFPDWLLSVSMQLQSDNVFLSIVKTADDAPELMQEELTLLIAGIEEDPNSLFPYTRFMKKLDIPDITSAMKILYSMARFGAADVQEQIHGLVQRNTMLMDRAEKLRMEDQLAGVGFLAMLPMFPGVGKLLVDLILVVMQLMALVQNI